MTASEPKKRANNSTKLMSNAIRVENAHSDLIETEDQLMADQALYNSTRETRGRGRPEGEGQSSGVTINFYNTGGTQESVNKKK